MKHKTIRQLLSLQIDQSYIPDKLKNKPVHWNNKPGHFKCNGKKNTAAPSCFIPNFKQQKSDESIIIIEKIKKMYPQKDQINISFMYRTIIIHISKTKLNSIHNKTKKKTYKRK